MSQVIAVVSGKGGTGKTSFTTLTGMALAQLGKKTLLLDCDIGLRNLDLYLGVSDRALMDFTDVIAGRTTLAQAVVRHPLYPNLYLLTAPVSFGGRLPSKREMQRPPPFRLLPHRRRRRHRRSLRACHLLRRPRRGRHHERPLESA